MRPLIASIVLLAIPALGFAQGALTPPSGAPAPTMKTLDQLEPRTPLKDGAPGVIQNDNGTFIITNSGSYYLTANLNIAIGDGIRITASGVTLDLSGFTISSTTASPKESGTAVYIYPNLSDITIRNGHIRGNTVYDATAKTFTNIGFSYGIYSYSKTNTVAENITVSNVVWSGIEKVSVIDKCSASVCGGSGLVADQVQDSSADICDFTAVRAYKTASNCYGSSIHYYGVYATTASNCIGESQIQIGLYAGNATNCKGVTSTGTYGAHIENLAENCEGIVTGTDGNTGFRAVTAINCHGKTAGTGLGIEANTATSCFGESTNNDALRVINNAENCRGIATGSGCGLWTGGNALNSYGSTATGSLGLWATGTANSCRGNNSKTGGVALQASIAIGCTAESGTIAATNRYLMP